MGMFSDYQTVKKQAKEMQKRSDVKGSLATMQSKLETLNGTLAQAGEGRAMVEGVAGTATVTSAQPTGAMINFAPVYQLGLIVMMPGRPPFPATRSEVVPQLYLSRALPGQSVSVRVMADDPNDVFIDWAAP